jgi:dienelactone hydrolase
MAAVAGFEQTRFRHGAIEHALYCRGAGRGVVVMHELSGLTTECLRLGERIAQAGWRVYLPLLFGQPQAPAPWRHLAGLCLGREFHLLARGGPGPIAGWLRALCRRAHEECGGPGVAAIGLCLTGNFAIALMADARVLAPVAAEPAQPLFALTAAGKGALAVAPEDLEGARARAAHGQRLLGLRFTQDRLCPAARFATLERRFGAAFEPIEIDSSPGNRHGIPARAHSVLTKDFVDQAGHPTRQALERVLGFLQERLGNSGLTPPPGSGG